MTHTQRQHFELLDGLRGMAALAVVIFHFAEIIAPDGSHNFIGHGFLAVDFFFCLSGFVIAYAYDDRIDSLGLAEFFRSRLIRLHPMVVLGSVLGLLGFYIQSQFSPAGPIDWLAIAGIFLCSLLMIPLPIMAGRFYNNFGLNAPAWSLFWEYIANVLYALVLRRIHRRYLMMLIGLAAAAIVWVITKEGSLLGGWSGGTFWDGLVRVTYSFLAGMFIYRSKWIISNRLGFWPLAIGLLLAFLAPFGKWNVFSESLIVLIYFPLLIALGAGTAPAPRVQKFCVFAGKMSYPLYMTHYWLMWMFGDYMNTHRPAGMPLLGIVLGTLASQLILAWLVMVRYDIPVRQVLSRQRRVPIVAAK